MRRLAIALLLPLVLVAGLALAPASSAGAGATARVSTCGLPGISGTSSPDSRLGVLAAIGCGFFWRATIVTAGTQMGTIVGAVACCGYLVFDAMTETNH